MSGQQPEQAPHLDDLKRVAWTAFQAGAGAALDVLTSGQVTWRSIVYAVAVAALKAAVRAGARNRAGRAAE